MRNPKQAGKGRRTRTKDGMRTDEARRAYDQTTTRIYQQTERSTMIAPRAALGLLRRGPGASFGATLQATRSLSTSTVRLSDKAGGPGSDSTSALDYKLAHRLRKLPPLPSLEPPSLDAGEAVSNILYNTPPQAGSRSSVKFSTPW